MPDTEFPPKTVRNESLDLLTTDREFFVAAKRVGGITNATEIEATLWNRSRWPARVTTNLGFRYFFTLDNNIAPTQVEVTLTGDSTANVSPVILRDGRMAFVEVTFPGDAIYPGNLRLAGRAIKLRLTAPDWNEANDWSADGLSSASKLLPRLPVYDGGKLVGGMEP